MKKTKKEQRNLNLQSFLITPVQRIPRYNLTLKEINKNTWRDHPDYENLQAAGEQVAKTALYVNQRANEAIKQNQVFELQKKIPDFPVCTFLLHESSPLTVDDKGGLVAPGRVIIKEEGLMQEYGNKKKSIRTVNVVLLTDLLVLYNEVAPLKGSRSSLRRLISGDDNNSLISNIPLVKARLTIPKKMDCEEKGFFLSVSTRQEQLFIIAQTDKSRQEWFDAIQGQVDKLLEAERFYEGTSLLPIIANVRRSLSVL